MQDPATTETAPIQRRRSLSFQLAVALTLALLPIGILAAILAATSIRNTREAELVRAENQFRATARIADDLINVDFLVLRALLRNETRLHDDHVCDTEAANALDGADTFDAILWADGAGQPICQSAGAAIGLSTAELSRLASGSARESLVWPGGDTVFFAVRQVSDIDAPGLIVAAASVPRLKKRLNEVAGAERGVTVWLGDKPIVGSAPPGIQPPGGLLTVHRMPDGDDDRIVAAGPLAIFPFGLTSVLPATRLAPADILAIATPSAMWIAALLIGWFVVRRFVVLPLQSMASGVRAYDAGDDRVRLAGRAGQTDEILAFAETFDTMAKNMAEARQDLASALTEQRRLTREVHHRVKNNLQIVASLISIQAREADGADVGRAYAGIQMRVNALAIVHRWLYEESDQRGVDFSALAHDLCAGLQQIIPSAKHVEPRINTHMERLHISQDAAVPLAFLITEIVALAARRTAAVGQPKLTIDVYVSRTDEGGCLKICTTAFDGVDELAPSVTRAAARIVNGMVRQLRGRMTFDADTPCYTVEFPIAARP